MLPLRFLILLFLLRTPSGSVRSPRPRRPRPPDEPALYSGDLSIFESPGRDKRLQVDRVMDILGIGPGKQSQISVPVRDGSRSAPRAR